MKTAPPVTLRDAAAAIEAEHGILLRARERVRLGCFVEVEVFFLGGGGTKREERRKVEVRKKVGFFGVFRPRDLFPLRPRANRKLRSCASRASALSLPLILFSPRVS